MVVASGHRREPMPEHLDPERAARLLRAKAAELEARVKAEAGMIGGLRPVTELAADIALVAVLLADAIERWDWSDNGNGKAPTDT